MIEGTTSHGTFNGTPEIEVNFILSNSECGKKKFIYRSNYAVKVIEGIMIKKKQLEPLD